MSRFITIKDDYSYIDIVPSNVAYMRKSSGMLNKAFTIEIACYSVVYLSYRLEEARDEAYKEIKALIEELTE